MAPLPPGIYYFSPKMVINTNNIFNVDVVTVILFTYAIHAVAAGPVAQLDCNNH